MRNPSKKGRSIVRELWNWGMNVVHRYCWRASIRVKTLQEHKLTKVEESSNFKKLSFFNFLQLSSTLCSRRVFTPRHRLSPGAVRFIIQQKSALRLVFPDPPLSFWIPSKKSRKNQFQSQEQVKKEYDQTVSKKTGGGLEIPV